MDGRARDRQTPSLRNPLRDPRFPANTPADRGMVTARHTATVEYAVAAAWEETGETTDSAARVARRRCASISPAGAPPCGALRRPRVACLESTRPGTGAHGSEGTGRTVPV